MLLKLSRFQNKLLWMIAGQSRKQTWRGRNMCRMQTFHPHINWATTPVLIVFVTCKTALKHQTWKLAFLQECTIVAQFLVLPSIAYCSSVVAKLQAAFHACTWDQECKATLKHSWAIFRWCLNGGKNRGTIHIFINEAVQFCMLPFKCMCICLYFVSYFIYFANKN